MKIKISPMDAMKVYGGIRHTAPLVLNVGSRYSTVISHFT